MARSKAVVAGGAGEDPKPRLSDLLRRSQSGDKAATASLREIMDKRPDLWRQAGDLAVQAENALIGAIAGDSVVVRDAIGARLIALREEVQGWDPTPLERLLAERVVACWLEAYYADIQHTQRSAQTFSLEQGDYFQRRQDRAHKRYLSAIRTLAQVRKLLTPSMQVNIAEQQVNFAGHAKM